MNQFTVEADSLEHFKKSCHLAVQELFFTNFVRFSPVRGVVLEELSFWKARRGLFENQFLTDPLPDKDHTLENEYSVIWNRILNGVNEKGINNKILIQQELGSFLVYVKDRLISVSNTLREECFLPLFAGKLDIVLDMIWLKHKQGNNIQTIIDEFFILAQRFKEGYPTISDGRVWIEKNSGERSRSFAEQVWEMYESMRDQILNMYQNIYLEFICVQEMELYPAHNKDIPVWVEMEGLRPIQFISTPIPYPDITEAVISALMKLRSKSSVSGEWIPFIKGNKKPHLSNIAEYIGHKNGSDENNKFAEPIDAVQLTPKYLQDDIFRKLNWEYIKTRVPFIEI